MVPPEILTLVPDFLDDEDEIVTLTHVCQAWRGAFISRACLWTYFDCKDGEKTRVYFERSKSSPIRLLLDKSKDISLHNPFFQVIPRATGRLESLSVKGTTESIQVIISRLSYSAPLLEHLSIDASHGDLPYRHPTITSALFNGDLSSLRTLHLVFVHTELPWRNMVNLTSFTLSYTSPISIEQLIDFLESAPYLRTVELYFATLAVGIESGRLVSLACLKSMKIDDDGPPCALLDHLLIPVGVELEIMGDVTGSLIGEVLPRSLDNLKNLHNFTKIRIRVDKTRLLMKFSGPNGQVSTISRTFRADPTNWLFESLVQLDASKTERLEMHRAKPPSGDLLNQALLSMTGLRTLTLGTCRSTHIFIQALRPSASSSEVMPCPKLEGLTLVLRADEEFDITGLVEMAVARASGGKKLRTIEITNRGGDDLDVSELRKHVWNVEYVHEVVEPMFP